MARHLPPPLAPHITLFGLDPEENLWKTPIVSTEYPPPKGGVKVLVSWISLGLAILALVAALGAFWVPQKQLRKAFRALERECDDQWEKIESHMGRVSRLKRSMMAGEVATKEAGTGDGAAVPPARLQTRGNLLARWKRAQ